MRILEAYDPSNNFDEELFEKIVVGITVNSNADLTFKLIGDIELTEEIPLKGRCRRRGKFVIFHTAINTRMAV